MYQLQQRQCYGSTSLGHSTQISGQTLSGYFCEDAFGWDEHLKWWLWGQVDYFLLCMWASSKQLKAWNRTKTDLFIERRNSAIRLPLDSNYSSFLNLQPSSLPYQIWGSTITCARASQVAEWKRICLPMQETQEMQVWPLRQEDTLE